MFPIHRLYRHLLSACMLLLIGAVYWPALHGGFIFDDYPIFADNRAIQVHGWDWHSWQAVWSWSRQNIERPVAMATYAFNYAMGGSTFGFKLTNLLIHLFNTLLLAALTRRLLRAAWPEQNARHTEYWALGIAALWALHPLQVSTVMYVVQRMEMLAFTFVMLALLAYWRGRQQQIHGRRAWPWLLLAVALTIAGYGFKENAILVPGYALLLELMLLHFGAADTSVARRWRGFYAAGFVMAVLMAALYVFPHYANPAYYAGRDFTAWQRELTQLRALPLYLGWILLPLPSHLAFYYDDYVASTSLLQPMTTLWGGVVLLALMAFACAIYKRRPLMALGIGCFFVAHALTSAPVPLELVFEHRNYPALFGIVLALADLVYVVSVRSKSSAAIVLACVLAGNMVFLTTLRSSVWGSSFRLAVELVDINPNSSRAALDLARRAMTMSGGNFDSPMYSVSIQQLERATRTPSASPLPEEALLIEAAKNPRIPSQPWWDSLRRKLETRPLIPDTYATLHKLTTIRLQGNTQIDAKQLVDCYAIATRRNPDREMLHAEYAELAGAALGDQALAIDQWQRTLRLDRDVPAYGPQLAAYLSETHRHQEAIAVILLSQQLAPSLANNAELNQLLAKARSAEAAAASGTPNPATSP